MSPAPRLEVDLDKVRDNARTLVDLLAPSGITVTGVTKATLGSADVADAMLRGGVAGLGDSRVENLESLHRAGVVAPVRLIRSPMPSQVDRVVASADITLTSELAAVDRLSAAACRQDRNHGVVLMVDLGDLREGVLARDLHGLVRETLRRPGIRLAGIGTNLACHSGVIPDLRNMGELSELAGSVEAAFGLQLDMVSGGNSANLDWALSGADTGRVDALRLGEAILLGREPLHRGAVPGLHTDAVRLVAEVIESKRKPARPWGDTARSAFGDPPPSACSGDVHHVLLAVGHQDTDPDGLTPPSGTRIVGASSDHLVMTTSVESVAVGDELGFEPDYSALVRAMTSPFVTTVFGSRVAPVPTGQRRR